MFASEAGALGIHLPRVKTRNSCAGCSAQTV